MAFKYKKKGSPYWQIGWYDPVTKKPGKPFSTKTKNARLADQKVKEFEDAQKEDREHSESILSSEKIVKLSRAFELYVKDRETTGEPFNPSTLDNYNNALNYFYPAAGDKKVYLYTKEDYNCFFISMRDLSQNSKAVYSKCIYALFRWLVKEKYILDNPMKRVKEEDKEFRIITEAELEKIRGYAWSTKYYHLIEFLILSAFRSHEALKMKYSDIEQNIIRVKGKGSKYSHIVILPEMRDFLKLLPEPEHPDQLVFPYTYDILNKFWYAMKKETKVRGDITPHDLRKYCLSKMANHGVAINFVKEYARHSSINTTLKYYIRADLEKMVDEISEKVRILKPLS